jgi:F-type H+-transporting ATPase subunit delta
MADRYASALFSLAAEQNSLEKIAADLDAFARMMAQSADLRRLVRGPAFSAEDQTRALAALLSRAGIAGLAANFLKLVAAKRRLFAIAAMIRAFHAMLDVHRGVARAQLTIAEPLAERHLAAIREAIATTTSARSVEVDVKIDPSIIGGLIVRIGSRLVDASVRTKLNLIRTRMKEVR